MFDFVVAFFLPSLEFGMQFAEFLYVCFFLRTITCITRNCFARSFNVMFVGKRDILTILLFDASESKGAWAE